ncbi:MULTISPECIES: VWA domain-containing protein [Cupriavidus]|uniref:von Willebrand factor, type A n=1 Tax=Cupriavidus pinatubonensis (strain JMP 134 / LMG 1197) TaxID=264198 RepID=Q46SQ8_CUPPJ|nr:MULTISPECIES: VWA domain-containing protein [Cupriavidus]QYY28476.1 VWA domain-containing protein [Cupriavidus pinatubonensis]TPQ36328.1 VWA domain-containing protein [Cupriavidus pinatubonensis]
MTDAIDRLPLFSFLWPDMLWLLGLLFVLTAGYVWFDARRRRTTVSHPALKSIGFAMTGGTGWRRHVPAVLALLALVALIFAIARPQAVMTLPSRIKTVILVIDLSGSMRAQDVRPSRIRAAQQAARVLLDAQPAGVSVGVVAMAGTAALAQAPSHSKDDVATAIEGLKPQGGTALGNGLLIALTTLLPQTTNDAERLMNGGDVAQPGKPGKAAPGELDNGEPVRPGSYASGAIVLFSDGESNSGPGAVQAAQLAATYGVRVYTVGVGTTEGVVLSADGWSARVRLDEKVLKQVADTTGAEYFRLEDTAALKKVYRALNTRLAFDKRDQVEVTAFFAAIGALLAACAGLLSLWWFGRVM